MEEEEEFFAPIHFVIYSKFHMHIVLKLLPLRKGKNIYNLKKIQQYDTYKAFSMLTITNLI